MTYGDNTIAAQVEFFDQTGSEHRALVDRERLGLNWLDRVGGEREFDEARRVAEREVVNGANSIAV